MFDYWIVYSSVVDVDDDVVDNVDCLREPVALQCRKNGFEKYIKIN